MNGSAGAEDTRPWWSTYFDEVFLRIYRPLKDDETTAIEVDAVCALLGIEPGASVLDVGCGWGRHSLELARQGLKVTGVDLSERLLEEAEKASSAEGLDVRWVAGDMRKLDFRREFDVAISMFSTLGYFSSDDDDIAVLAGIREAVVPSGLLLIECMHRDLIAREFAERDWWETPDGDLIWVERSFDAVAGISHEVLRWRSPTGETGEKSHSIRIRSAPELDALLQRAGWRPIEWVGGWDLEPFTHQSERLMVVAQRA